MKLTPWKNALVIPFIAIGLVACEPDDNTPGPDSYPTDDLNVEQSQSVYLAEMTNVTCGDCPVTQEAMEIAKARYPDNIVPISIHTTDTFANYPGIVLEEALGNDQSNPVKLFIQGVQVTSDPFVEIENIITNQPPLVSVMHAVRENDTAWLVYPKIKFFQDNTEDLFIQSYVLLDGVVARDYGAFNLTQAANDPRIQQGSGGNPTVWVANGGEVDSVTYLYSQGSVYQHHDVIYNHGYSDTTDYGISLTEINPLENNYFIGDIFGTQYIPIEIAIRKPDYDMASAVGADLKFVTIIWSRTEATPPIFTYVNGYYSGM